MKMKFEIPTFLKPFLFLFLISGIGCGMQNSNVYNLTQSGAQFTSAQCSTVRLTVSESNSQISGSGSNPCFNQTLSGTKAANGQMNVTLSLIPVTSATSSYGYGGGMYGASSTNCTYQGVLMVSGSSIQGVLNPVSSFGYGCLGSITINGTRN